MKIFFTTISFLILSTVLLPGQGAWTLEQCVSYAVENSPSVNSSEARSEIWHRNKVESVASLFPSLSAGVSGQFAFGRGLNDDNTYSNVNSFSHSYSLNGSMTLFDGLASVYRIKMNKAGDLMGIQDLQKAKDDVAYRTMELFFLAQGYAEMAQLCREQLEESNRNLLQTERMAEVGLKGYPDVAEMKAQAAGAKYSLTKQENLLQITMIKLKEQMNLPLDADLEIVPFAPPTDVAYAGESPMEIYSYASGSDPAVLSAKMNEDYSLYSYKATKGNMYPSLSVNGGFNTGFYRSIGSSYENYWHQLRNKRGHYVGGSINIPIFSGLSRSSNTKRAALNLRIARNQTDQALRTLYSEIEQAVADVNGQADEYKQLRLQTEAAEVAYELSLRKYNEGLINAVELYTSSNRLLQSKAESTSSILLYHLKSKLLDYYKGIPYYTE